MTPQELSNQIRHAVQVAIEQGQLELELSEIPAEIVVERPKNLDHGDWATLSLIHI